MADALRPAPLAGLRVLEFASWLAVPATGALLADLGAQVIKVEPPTGDASRGYRMQPFGFTTDFPINYGFEADNRGKRSIVLDLQQPAAAEIVQRLANQADVVMTNLVPGRLERYGLTYALLAEQNPRMIYLALTGYGKDGPDRDRLGFDQGPLWARSGILSMMVRPGDVPPLPPSGVGDHATVGLLLSGILTALLERERSGRGQEVQASLLGAGLFFLTYPVSGALVAHQEPRDKPRTEVVNPLRNFYQTRDGSWLNLMMPQSDRHWPQFCQAIGRPELVDHPRYATAAARTESCVELIALLDEVFLEADMDEWALRLNGVGLLWDPIRSVQQAINDPQVEANGFFTTVEHPTHGAYDTLASPLRFSHSESKVRGPAPELGQHTEEILLEIGYTWEDIATLRAGGALG